MFTKPKVLWFTGLPCSGKSTIAEILHKQIQGSAWLDGDHVRRGLCSNLGFSDEDRRENLRRIAEAAKLFLNNGQTCIVSVISPLIEQRQMARSIIGSDNFVEIYISTPLDVCERRDVKGMYKKARLGLIKDFTGVTSPYEPPTNSELTFDTVHPVDSTVRSILAYCGKDDIYHVFVGRWCPFHKGHWEMMKKVYDEDPKPLLILVRDTPYDELNAVDRKIMIDRSLEILGIPGTAMIIPDICTVNYGRGVGYEVRNIEVDSKIQGISATAIREKIHNNDSAWKELVMPGVVEFFEGDTMTVIVTGVPRSGTSLQMQTLKLLGMEIVGDEFPQMKLDRDEESIDRSKQLNPKGFYEDWESVMRGTQDKEKLQGKAIKIIVDGLPERMIKRKDGDEVKEIEIGTSSEIIDDAKIILCLRDPMQVAESQTKLMGNVHIADDNGGFQDMISLMPENPERYVVEMGRFYFWLKKVRPELEEKMLKVDFDDMHSQPEAQVDRVIDFIGLDCTEEQWQSAITNVSGNLKRSVHTKSWRPEHEATGALATGLYRYFKQGESLDEQAIEDFLIDRMLENVSWVDTEFGLWTRSNPVFHRQLSENLRGLRDKMTEQYKGRRNQTFCEHFGYSEEEYTIRRPKVIGDLVRKKIACKKDNENKSIEQCYMCFHQGSMF